MSALPIAPDAMWSTPAADVPDPAVMPGFGMPVIDWARLLRCTECGARDTDFGERGAAVTAIGLPQEFDGDAPACSGTRASNGPQ